MKAWGIRMILRDGTHGWMEEKAYCLKASDQSGHLPAVAIERKVYPICTQAATRDADRGNRCGVGMGANGDPTSTLRTGCPPAVAIAEREREMEKPQYVVRRITPVEAERLQGFPEVIYLNTDIINRDEAVVFALVNGDIFAKPDTGQLFRTRGPGGKRLNTPIEIDGSNCNGYKVFSLHAKGKKWQIKKHRAIWISVNGIPSNDMVVDHINNDKTDNRIANLQLLTPEDNSTKASIDGCYLCGDDNPQTKLPVEMRDVVYKDYLSGAGTYRQLAEKYGVSKSRIAQIVQSKGYTNVEFKGKPAPDTARYKALGNSMTVNVMAWIAKRILMVEKGEL